MAKVNAVLTIIALALDAIRVVGLIALGLFLGRFLTAYSARKGENRADREDARVIESERVKGGEPTEKRLSAARVAYGTAGGSEASLRMRREQELIRFYMAAAVLLGDKLVADHGDFPRDGGASLLRHGTKVKRAFKELRLGYYGAVLFMREEDKALHASITELVSAGWELNKTFNRCFVDVRLAYIAAHEAFGRGEAVAIQAATARVDAADKAYRDGMRPPGGRFMKAFDAYMVELNAFLGGHGLRELPVFDD